MSTTKQFLNDVVKPWEVLNESLAQNYAIHDEVSDFSRQALQLAIAIKHQPEAFGLRAQMGRMCAQSPSYNLVSDVADAAKHGALRNSSRDNKLHLSALHEFNHQNQFRFIRNAIAIKHNTYGERDFLETALEAVNYCVAELGLDVQWVGMIKEAPVVFQDKVKLRFDPRLGVGMNNFSLTFVTRASNGVLVLADPPNGFPIEVEDLTPLINR